MEELTPWVVKVEIVTVREYQVYATDAEDAQINYREGIVLDEAVVDEKVVWLEQDEWGEFYD